MKELSIEQKAKAYDEAIERAKKWYDANTNEGYRGIFDDIFPELKESEDERVELLNYLYDVHDDDEERARWIAWLEKPAWSEEDERMLDEMYEFFDTHKIPSLKHPIDNYAKFIKHLKEKLSI